MRFAATCSICGIFSVAAGLATVLALGLGHSAQAQTLVDPNSRVSAVPGYAGTGLFGNYYYRGTPDSQFESDIINLNSSTITYPSLATFLSTNICYPDCQGGSISDYQGGLRFFLNGNATNILFADPNPQNEPQDFSYSGLILEGYIAINQIGTYNFNLNSDDGSQLRVGDYVGGSNTLEFTATGLYQIAVNFFEHGGGSLLSLTDSDSNTQTCLFGCYDGSLLANDLFYSQGQLQGAPAPTIGSGPSGLAVLSLLGLGAVYRRRSQTKTV
jgi:hypothetical protein